MGLKRKTNIAVVHIDSHHSHVTVIVTVGGNCDVHIPDDPLEGLLGSSCSNCSSRRVRSVLFMNRAGLFHLAMACLSTVSVCTQTPDTQSTTTRAPSVTVRAAVTSEEKSVSRRIEHVDQESGLQRAIRLFDLSCFTNFTNFRSMATRESVSVDLKTCSPHATMLHLQGN